MGSEESNKLHLEFEWKSFGILLLWVLVLCSIGLTFLCVVRWGLVQCGFSATATKLVAQFVPLFEKCVWPGFVLFIIYLFRNNLNEAVNAVAIMRNGKGDDIAKSSQERFFDHVCSGAPHRNQQTVDRTNEFVVLNHVMAELQKENDARLMREVSVMGSRFSFDAAFKKGMYVYAVEVKTWIDEDRLREYLIRVDEYVSSLPERDARRFVFLLCLCNCSLTDLQLTRIRQNVEMKIEYREYRLAQTNDAEKGKIK